MKVKLFAMIGIFLSMIFTATAAGSSDQNIVARTIFREARGDGTNGMYAVACVIQERAIKRRLRPREVCLQPKQFSCWNKATSTDLEYRSIGDSGLARYANALAAKIIANERLDRSFVGYADYYCEVSLNPKWTIGRKPVAVVGGHKFYKF